MLPARSPPRWRRGTSREGPPKGPSSARRAALAWWRGRRPRTGTLGRVGQGPAFLSHTLDVASTGNAPGEVQYSISCSGGSANWPRTGSAHYVPWAIEGLPGDGPRGIRLSGCTAVWGSAPGVLAVFVELALLVIQKGASLAAWLVALAVVLLVVRVFIRVHQSKLARKAPATEQRSP
jgi:hypothetical protein